jgi:hypothetical protein
MQAGDLLDMPLIIDQAMDDDELAVEWERAKARSHMTQLFVVGKVDVESYLDFMAEQGFEPAELLDVAEANLAFCIAEGIPVE